MIKEFKEFGIEVSGFDPLLGRDAIEAFGIDAAEDIKGMGADCVVMAVSHDAFKDITLGRAQRCDEQRSGIGRRQGDVLWGGCSWDGILLRGAVTGWGG